MRVRRFRRQPIGTTSDVYSFGVVAFELLAGVRPYRLQKGGAAALEKAMAELDPPLASAVAEPAALRTALRGDLDAILNKALKKDPAERYDSLDAFAQDLERHRRHEPVLAQPDRAAYRLRKFVARHRVSVLAGSAIAASLVIGVAAALLQAREARGQAARAERMSAFVLSLFRSAVPETSEHAKTAADLMKEATRRIDAELPDDHETAARLLVELAEFRISMGDDEGALEIVPRQPRARGRRRRPLRHRVSCLSANR